MSEVTRILERAREGDAGAADELIPLVYAELRRLAALKMAGQPAGHTLQPTALVHEAYLRLVGSEQPQWKNSRHFLFAAAEAMRHILIDRARRRLRSRHGANPEMVELNEIEIASPVKEEVLMRLDEALTELSRESPERAEIVKLRFFAGFSEAEIAGILDLSERSVQRQWAFAKAWLFERIEDKKVF